MAAPTIDATAKGASANSYVTRANAQSYFDERYGGSATWEAASTTDRDRALITATRRLDLIDDWNGQSTDTTTPQALDWPRTGIVDEDGVTLDEDTIPTLIKHATYETALALLNGSLTLSDTGLEGYKSVTVGQLSVEPFHGQAAGAIPRHVSRLLIPVRSPADRVLRT